MSDTTTMERLGDLRAAFIEHERQVRISTGRLACWLVILLMPLGTIADWFMYPERLGDFLKLRLLCSFLVIGIWLLHSTPLARKQYPLVGMPIVLLPSFFMTWMVFSTENLPLGGAASPYYAALNLILLAVSAVGHWSMRETFFAVGSVLCMYLGFAFPLVNKDISGIFFINVYFLALTGIIVVAGNHLFNRLRFREFVLRHELDKNKKTLEQTNQKLDAQNKELADTIKKLTEAEAQLVQQEKMASLGRWSAGIIHEINNPLNFVKTGLYTLKHKDKYLPPDQQAEYIDILKDVEDGFNRVMNIVSSTRGFTHHDDELRGDVPVAELVDESLRFVSHELRGVVQLEKNLAAGQTVHGNKNKLIMVCINLLENSLHAFKLKDFKNGKQPTISISSRMENGRSMLTFADNGPGIQPEHLDKIFEPFFTTKDVGEGMGMGLYNCHRLVHESGGQITVKTEVGKFCEFTLEFPAKE
jgi:two-component system, sensor histidine kinase PhcS